MGMDAAVRSLTRPAGKPRLKGPAPVDENGLPIAPVDATGHDHLWWLDRMVRSDQPLVERMTLIFHDWFATSRNGVSLQRQMIDQSNLFRRFCFGSFLTLFERVTVDPAMLTWLNGNKNAKSHPNENYAREMMELFSLGAKRGYSESDIREMARALTGWRSTFSPERGAHNYRFDRSHHDYGKKTVFGRTGNWNWKDAPRLCVENKYHPSYFVLKLWSYFIAQPPDNATRKALTSLYRKKNWRIRPVLEAILRHPDFYETGPMVKPPTVYLASMMRARGRYINSTRWVELSEDAGQLLFVPPDVSGWNDDRWLDTARLQARWEMVHKVLRPAVKALENPYPATETAEDAVDLALKGWGNPTLAAADRAELVTFAERSAGLAGSEQQQGEFRRLRQEGLMQIGRRRPGDGAPVSGDRTCCGEFTRSQALHAAAAEAGKGLPHIETGMPVPAGTGLSRRSLLLKGAGLALAVYGSRLSLPALDAGIAQAATPGRILVSVFLDGGLDAMSLLAPTGDPRYRKLRPHLALKKSETLPFSEDERLRWHPGAKKLAKLHGEGKVTVFPAISYSGPDQSHFTSRHFYEIGEVEVGSRTGWLGRYIDLVGDDENPIQGLSIDHALSPVLATAEKPVAAVGNADRLRADFGSGRTDQHGTLQRIRTARSATGRQSRPDPAQARDRPVLEVTARPLGHRRNHQPRRVPRLSDGEEAARPRLIHRQGPAHPGGDPRRSRRLRHPRRTGRHPRPQHRTHR